MDGGSPAAGIARPSKRPQRRMAIYTDMHGKLLRSEQQRYSPRLDCSLTEHSISLVACRDTLTGLTAVAACLPYKSEGCQTSAVMRVRKPGAEAVGGALG